MSWNRLAIASLAVALAAGALGLGVPPLGLGEGVESAMVLVCLVALGAFATAFLAGLDRGALLRSFRGAGDPREAGSAAERPRR